MGYIVPVMKITVQQLEEVNDGAWRVWSPAGAFLAEVQFDAWDGFYSVLSPKHGQRRFNSLCQAIEFAEGGA